MRYKAAGCGLLIALVLPLTGQRKEAPLGWGIAFSGQRWIAYAPTHYFPGESPPVIPTTSSLQADLTILREAGFTGLVTYGAGVEAIPRIAEEVGFKAILLGIWDPFNIVETEQALKAVRGHGRLVLGLVVGNEGLLNGRYDVQALCTAMDEIRRLAGKPVSTTETVDWVLSETKIERCSSFVTVNAHPYFNNLKTPEDAVRWTIQAWQSVKKQYPDKPILFKEVGLPSGGDEGLSEGAQKDYYVLLAKSPVVFSYFEAFDATPRFKEGAVEQSWGLWTADRRPKAVVRALPWKTERQ